MSSDMSKNVSCSCVDERKDFSPKNELIKLSLLIGTFLIANGFYYFNEDEIIQKISLVALFTVYIISGFSIFKTAVTNLIRGSVFDENLLMTIATIAAIIIGAYSEAVAVILFYRTGEFLQEWAVNRSRRSIRALLELNIDYVNKVSKNSIENILAKDVLIGDILEVRAGERIPLDGIVTEGQSMLDMKALTGEVIPHLVKKDDKVIAGAVNLSAVIRIEVLALYKDSYISKILSVVEGAKDKKAKTENFITTFAKYYTPIVFLVSVLVATVPPIFGLGEFSDWVYRALVVLVVSCPCALVISIPLGYFASIGAAAKSGILIKGANYIEVLDKLKAIVFDKTGTLTKGSFEDIDILPEKDISSQEFLEYLLASMTKSNHPISKAIVQKIGNDIDINNIKNYEELHGLGVKLQYKNKEIVAGNSRLISESGVNIDDNTDYDTTVHLVCDNLYYGKVVLSDSLREGTKATIDKLRSLGINDMMILSGDNEANVKKVASKLSIKDLFSSVLPIEKAERFFEYRKKINGKVMYVGDGINDAPVLAASDIGVSFADISSDIAIESADMVLLNPSLDNIVKSIKLSKRTKIIIWQNIIFALTVKLIFIILGILGVATIYEAVFGDVGVALIALLNAMRLMKNNN